MEESEESTIRLTLDKHWTEHWTTLDRNAGINFLHFLYIPLYKAFLRLLTLDRTLDKHWTEHWTKLYNVYVVIGGKL